VIASDWRLLPASTTAQLYRRERIRWRRRLAWETASTWHTLEIARTTWGLPGFVCHDRAGRVRGWTFYIVRNERLEVGGFVADDPLATRVLLDALLDRARSCDGLSGFLYSNAPGLDLALASHGVAGRSFLYLVHALQPVTANRVRPGEIGAWPGDDLETAARLFRAAYGETGRIFARQNQVHEWEEYVGNLVRDPACGVFSPALSRVWRDGDRCHALAIVTMISRHTAHLAQIAVHPAWQRRGVAQELLEDVLRSARDAGVSRVSLLVGGDNLRARALYRRMGFVKRETFVAIEATESPVTSTGRPRPSAPARRPTANPC
jgi:ribosomal protein S18 acetylase RimI-like enzyme